MRRHHPILLLGASGQVGWELQRTLATLGAVVAPGASGALPKALPRVDLSDAAALRAVVAEVRPALIVNAAAYTAVDRAEEEPALAEAINTIAPGVLAEEAKRCGCALVHYSTDYVFDGAANRPYREDDPTAPQGVYGRTKLAGEEAVRAVGGDHLILRTAWVYGLRGHNFLRTMLRLGGERERLAVVDDQRGTPTWSRAIAEATAQVVAQPGALSERGGTYHLTCDGETTWHGFAAAIFRRAPHLEGAAPPALRELKAITTAEYPTPARRPAYSVLDNGRLEEAFGVRLPPWERALDLCVGHDGTGAPV
ncbi:dTDP-4-dehydrorhamnose reductase [Endothiovibrio diazotrophicus]